MARENKPPSDAAQTLQQDVSAWRWMLAVLAWFWAAAGVAGVAAGVFALAVFIRATYEGKPGPAVTVEIPAGATGQDIAKLLTDHNLIDHEGLFRLALRFHAGGANLKQGVYELPQGYSARQLLEQILKGPSRQLLKDQFKLTIPEGLSVPQVATQFDNPDQFQAAAAKPELIARLGLGTETLEGFLMPNTYFFDAEPTEEEAVARMVAQFELEYEKLKREIPGADQFDLLTIVTVASLVEEEARAEEERPLVASVIYNRMREGMPLQMDSTLQFALGKYGQRMLDEDKRVESPYNTYKYAGLPPGPISSPGAGSLRAAMQPAESPYFYFVSNADGRTHTFSETLAQHNAAVARYNREMAQQRREERQGSTVP